MRALELFHQDGQSAGIFVCQVCQKVFQDQAAANLCCVCSECQQEANSRNYSGLHSECWDVRSARIQAQRLEKAREAQNYASYVYWPGTGDDGFSPSLDDLIDELANSPDIAIPEFVFACQPISFHFDLDRSLEHCLEAMYEEASQDLEGLLELEAAVNRFNEQNKQLIAYQPDYTQKVRIPREDITDILADREDF